MRKIFLQKAPRVAIMNIPVWTTASATSCAGHHRHSTTSSTEGVHPLLSCGKLGQLATKCIAKEWL